LLQQHDIARHEPIGEEPDRLTVAQNFNPLRQQSAQRSQRSLDSELLPEREHSAGHDNGQNRVTDLGHTLAWIAPLRDKCQRRRKPQDQCEKVRELLQEATHPRFTPYFFNPIEPELAESPLGFRR
jgi:hypothetical protein